MHRPAKPYAAACDENRDPILGVLRPLFADRRAVLEIGSGTGQHAVYFASALPHLTWQTSDVAAHLPGIRAWLDEARLPNLPPPLPLDVSIDWPDRTFDAVFSANTAHIMSEPEVETMLRGVAGLLGEGGCFALYGPFSYDGQHTSASNARFDQSLRARDPRMGVRDAVRLAARAASLGLRLEADHAMPVNNRTLVWRRVGDA